MRHARAVDLSGITDPAARTVIEGFFDACEAPLGRIRNRTGKKVPVTIGDLSRFLNSMDENGHGHLHNEDTGEHGHLLGVPEVHVQAQAPGIKQAINRRQALGVFWLPTPDTPAGRIEVDRTITGDAALTREVVGAEFAHAFDYGAVNPKQRAALYRLMHDTPSSDVDPSTIPAEMPDPEAWFEGHPGGYWSWPGERFMGLFCAAYAPSLPRPLEARQPWKHQYDAGDVVKARTILRRP